MDNEELREVRKQMIAQMEQKLHETWSSEEDSLFYYHRSEDRIVLSHALFWVMSQPQCLKGKIRKEQFFLLLRQYQAEMLDAYLQDTEDLPLSLSLPLGMVGTWMKSWLMLLWTIWTLTDMAR